MAQSRAIARFLSNYQETPASGSAGVALEGDVNHTVIAREPSADKVSGRPLINVIPLTD